MEWQQSSLNKDLIQKVRITPLKVSKSNPDIQTPSEIRYAQLQQSYNERIRALENKVKDIYREIKDDDLIKTLEKNEITNDFKSQRIQEIVEESLLEEKEKQIEQLIQMNCFLKEEAENLADISSKEILSLHLIVKQMEGKLKEEKSSKRSLREENESLKAKVGELMERYENALLKSGCQSSRLDEDYRNNLANIEAELEKINKEKDTIEYNSSEKDKMIQEIKQEREKLYLKISQVEQRESVLKIENYKLNESVKELKESKEKNKKYEEEIEALKKQLETAKKDMKESQNKVQTQIKDLVELSLSPKFKLEKESEKVKQEAQEKIEDIKKKYKGKVEKHKTKAKELTSVIEGLNGEISALRQSLDESKLKQQKIKGQMEEELRIAKVKWEEVSLKLELDHQKAITELETSHHKQIKQIQDQQKMIIETKLYDSRTLDLENYILRSKHESILATEVWDLKNKYEKEIQRINQEFERELNTQILYTQENEKMEYNNLLKSMKEKKSHVEEELNQSRREIKNLMEKQYELIKVVQNLKEELESSQRKSKNLERNLEETNETLANLQVTYNIETKKILFLEEDNKELNERHAEATKIKAEYEAQNNKMKDQVRKLEENLESMQNLMAKAKSDQTALSEENGLLRKEIDKISQEKCKLQKELENNDVEKKKLLEKIDTESIEGKNKEKIIINERGLKEKFEYSLNCLQKIEDDLRKQLFASQDECKRLNEEITNQRLNFKAKLSKVWSVACNEIANLKKMISNIKSTIRLQSEKGEKALQEDIKSLLKYFNTKVELVKEQKDIEQKRISEDFRVEIEKHKRTVQKYREENNELNKDAEKLNEHVLVTINTLENNQIVIAEYKGQIESLKQENCGLIDMNIKLDKELQQLRNEVNINFPEKFKRMEIKYKKELEKVLGELENLKEDRISKLKLLEKGVTSLQNHYEGLIEETKKCHLNDLAPYEKKMTHLKLACEEQLQENSSLNEELKKLREKYFQLEQEKKRMIQDYEDKLATIKKIAKEEDNYGSFKKDKFLQENGNLKREVEALKLELQMRDLKVNNLNQIRADQQECIFKYKGLIDKRYSTNDIRQTKFRLDI